jgi:predicted RNase H-like HicB family nuclease
MNYPAIVSPEGRQTLIIFPDLPECQAIASVNDNFLKVAQDALVKCLKALLQKQEEPPHPSNKLRLRGTATALIVPVPDELAKTIEDRWRSR